MFKSRTSSFCLVGSALLLAALAPACGSNAPSSGFTSGNNNNNNNNNSNGQDASSSGDDDNNNDSDSGGGGGIFHGGDSGSGGTSNDDGGNCAGATATTSRQPVYIEFILDGSGSMSMNSDGTPTNKWPAATGALNSIFTQMGTANDPGVAAGLIVFSDNNDPTGGSGPYPSSADIPIAQVNATQAGLLNARFGGGDTPAGGTPTGTALGVSGGGGYSVVESFTPSGSLAAGGKRVLVLITDGVPEGDVCDIPSGGKKGTAYDYTTNPCVAYAAAQLTNPATANANVETFIIGTGIFPSTSLGDFDPSFLGYMAQAGGTGPSGCTPSDNTSTTGLCYFEVDPSGSSTATQTAFENALNAIRGQVASCTFSLDATDAGTIDPTKVNVTVNGTPIFLDPVDGWSYTPGSNDTSITLNGASCNTVKTTPNSTVNIQLGCASKPPPTTK